MVRTNTSERETSALRKLAGPSSCVPSTSWPEASIFVPSSVLRQRPIESKFSSEKPIGSMNLWHAAHTALIRCSSILCPNELGCCAPSLSLSGGTLGGGRG